MYLRIHLKLFPIQIVNYFKEKLPNEYLFMKKKKKRKEIRKVQMRVHGLVAN